MFYIPDSLFFCNYDKIIPAKYWENFSIHHLRHQYAEKQPLYTVRDVLNELIEFASNSDARLRGEVLDCWIQAVDDPSYEYYLK